MRGVDKPHASRMLLGLEKGVLQRHKKRKGGGSSGC